MLFITGLLLVVICVVAGIIILRRSRGEAVPEAKADNKNAQQVRKPNKPLSVFVIDHPANTTICESARKLHFRHFGQAQLPPLPLEDCDRKDACKCFHREVADKRRAQRRVNRERREQFRLDPTKPVKAERRVLKDRRAARTQWDGYDTDR